MVGISPRVYTVFHLDSMMGNNWALAILTLLVILISCPMESDCEEEFYNSKLQVQTALVSILNKNINSTIFTILLSYSSYEEISQHKLIN
jgi:hypothetical protein